jgi:hypothetical protein
MQNLNELYDDFQLYFPSFQFDVFDKVKIELLQ